jgi:hypothetical protein
MVMIKYFIRICILAMLVFFLFPGYAGASLTTISPGNVVFIGEQGLDISAAMEGDTQIGWWASGASITTSSPDKTIQISNPTSFSISPSDFGTPYTGSWYHITSSRIVNGTAFIVVDPRLDIKVEDYTLGYDTTDRWVPTGDEIQFQIDTNLYQITQRTGVTSVPITIKVQSPDGGTFDALINKAGVTTPIVNYPLKTTPQSTGPIWDTGRRDSYPPGTYNVWAECNVNSMKDNYGVIGKTISGETSMLNQDQNPLIHVNTQTPVPTATPTILPTTLLTTTLVSTRSVTQITSVPPAATTAIPLAVASTSPVTPASSTTRADGFDVIVATFGIILALALSIKKE